MIKLPIIIVDFNTPLSLMDRMTRKIIREIEDLNNTRYIRRKTSLRINILLCTWHSLLKFKHGNHTMYVLWTQRNVPESLAPVSTLLASRSRNPGSVKVSGLLVSVSCLLTSLRFHGPEFDSLGLSAPAGTVPHIPWVCAFPSLGLCFSVFKMMRSDPAIPLLGTHLKETKTGYGKLSWSVNHICEMAMLGNSDTCYTIRENLEDIILSERSQSQRTRTGGPQRHPPRGDIPCCHPSY